MVSDWGFLKGPGVMVGVGFTDPQCFLCTPGPWCGGVPPHLVVQAAWDMTWTVEPTWIVCQSCAGLVLIQALGLPEWREQWGVPGTPSGGEGPGG